MVGEDGTCIEFLLAVANGHDRHASAGVRSDFCAHYRDWFPAFFPQTLTADLKRYLQVQAWWSEPIAQRAEAPDEEFGYYVATFRWRLRVVWEFVASGNVPRARDKVRWLRAEIHRDYRLPTEPAAVGAWRANQRCACDWLERNIRRLAICTNRFCPARLYLRLRSNQKYCSTACADWGRQLWWQLRSKPVQRALTERGRRAISAAQTRRWQSYRREKRHSG
jgi:hypothetical protein